MPFTALGVRAHDLGRAPAPEIAARAAALGFSSVQLAPFKAIESLNASEGTPSAETAASIAQAFHQRGIRIAVLGCYVNLADPTPNERQSLITKLKQHLRLAPHFKCRQVATETGSRNPDWSAHPGNTSEEAYRDVLEAVASLLADADAAGVNVCLEAVSHHVISTPRLLRRLIADLRAPRIKALLDPVNLMSRTNWIDQAAVLEEYFELLGDRISVVHAKDFRIANGSPSPCPAGTGALDYALLFSLLRKLEQAPEIIVEETSPQSMAEACTFLRNGLGNPTIR